MRYVGLSVHPNLQENLMCNADTQRPRFAIKEAKLIYIKDKRQTIFPQTARSFERYLDLLLAFVPYTKLLSIV